MPDQLRKTQTDFFSYLLDKADGAPDFIIDDDKVGAASRLNIYYNAYRMSLSAALADNFERLKAYIGDEQFERVALGYIDKNPSKLRNLRYYGASFPAFLEQHFPGDGDLAELAQFDWHIRSAFDAADAQTLNVERIGVLGDGWVTHALALHPTATIMTMKYNTMALWLALEKSADPPPSERLKTETSVLIWRKELQPHFRSLSDQEANALAIIVNGCSFEKLAASLVEIQDEEQAIQSLGEWLRTWLTDGLLTEL